MNYFENERKIYFSKLKNKAIIPSKKDEDAGYDIYACFDEDFISIAPSQTKLIPTAIAWACSPNFYFKIEERSSMGIKGIKKSAGVIDSGYRGEIKIAITNASDRDLYISNIDEEELRKNGVISENALVINTKKAIAQGIVHRVEKMQVQEISYDELLKIESERGDKGWGSSNKK